MESIFSENPCHEPSFSLNLLDNGCFARDPYQDTCFWKCFYEALLQKKQKNKNKKIKSESFDFFQVVYF